MKKIKLTIAYLISFLLIAGYIVVLMISLNPKPSNEYRLFYLEHKLKYAPPEGALEARYGEKLYAEGEKDLFYGYGENQNVAETDLYFSNLSEEEHELFLSFKETDTDTLQIRINDEESGSISIDDNNEGLLTIPASSADNNGITKITLINPAKDEASGDNDDRGISIEYVRID